MPVYNDNTNTPELIPSGDYIFTVKKFECGISNGAKTNGSDKYEFELEIEGKGRTVLESLIDHPSCAWKLDCFLKCCGITIAKGESYEFRQDLAQANDRRWVNPIGLRGWCSVVVEEYTRRDGKKFKYNKIGVFYTDKEKLAPIPQPDGEFDGGF
jgi:hypothetical protein